MSLDYEEELMSEILWRYKELKNIKYLYNNSVTYENIKVGSQTIVKKVISSHSKYILRSSFPMIYAHWEGFFKSSIILLNKQLDKKEVDFNKINNALLMAISKDKHKDEYKNKKLYFEHIVINTESNLSWKVVQKFSIRYGFNIHKLSKYRIDLEQLLKIRNGISHGENAYHFDSYDIIDKYILISIKLMLILKSEIIYCLKYEKFYKEENAKSI